MKAQQCLDPSRTSRPWRLVLFVLLLSLFFSATLLNTLIFGYPCADLSLFSNNAQNRKATESSEMLRLSIVLPYTSTGRSTLMDSLRSWNSVGSPCLQNASDGIQISPNTARLVFYVNFEVQSEDQGFVELAQKLLGKHGKCFSSVHVIGAELTQEEDVYPSGPSNMFFKVFHDPRIRNEFRTCTHMFWMEHDVHPLRAGWVNALLQEAARGDFWMSGSVYMGAGLDGAVKVSGNKDWVGHINGNALYDLRDEAFRDFLRLVVQYEPPNHFWKPFDLSIWRVLHAFPYTWPLYQKFRSKFVYSDYIHNWGYQVSRQDLETSLLKPNVYLLHGSSFSAGNRERRTKTPPDIIWKDRVPNSTRLSIMISSTSEEVQFCCEAAMSTIKYVPNALDIVIVVPSVDFYNFNASFSACNAKAVRIFANNPVLQNPQMQQKWSVLHAEQYCQGDLILHLDSDMVFSRMLQLRDLLWLGKPILVYERYETLKATKTTVKWKEGTSFALGTAVEHEFSRSPLKVYPKTFYATARNHIERQHNTSLLNFFSAVLWNHTMDENTTFYFNVFDFLGAYAFQHARDSFALAPLDSDERRQLLLPPPLIVQPPLCHGSYWKAKTPRAVTKLLLYLKNTWRCRLPCNRIPELESSWENI